MRIITLFVIITMVAILPACSSGNEQAVQKNTVSYETLMTITDYMQQNTEDYFENIIVLERNGRIDISAYRSLDNIEQFPNACEFAISASKHILEEMELALETLSITAQNEGERGKLVDWRTKDYDIGVFVDSSDGVKEGSIYNKTVNELHEYFFPLEAVGSFLGTWIKDATTSKSTLIFNSRKMYLINHYIDNDAVSIFTLSLGDNGSLYASGASGWKPVVLSIDENGLLTYQAVGSDSFSVYHKESESVEIPKLKTAPLIGMSKDQIQESSWGRPNKINTTTTAYGTSEQWVYDRGYIYFENDVVSAIQESQ